MSGLTYTEKRQLERVLGMLSGYVLGFSNRTFEEFFREVAGVDIYDSVYDHDSGSKANRMRAFWNVADDGAIAAVLEELNAGLEDYSDEPVSEDSHALLTRIASRLRRGSAPSVGHRSKRQSIEEICFSVALSFPGTHRAYVARIAEDLKDALGMDHVFYDKTYQAQLARPNLDTLLQRVYRDQSRLVVVFLGGDYATSDWCGLEWRAIREIIKRKDTSQVMFVRLDAGDVDGALSIDGYIDANEYTNTQIVEFIIERAELLSSALVRAPVSPAHAPKDRDVPANPEFERELREAKISIRRIMERVKSGHNAYLWKLHEDVSPVVAELRIRVPDILPASKRTGFVSACDAYLALTTDETRVHARPVNIGEKPTEAQKQSDREDWQRPQRLMEERLSAILRNM